MEEQRPVVDSSFKSGPLYWHRFSILPNIRIRPADRYNTWGFSIHWLVFRAWTNMAPRIGFEIDLDDQNLSLRLNLPYLHTGLFIPVFPQSWSQKLWWTQRRNNPCNLDG